MLENIEIEFGNLLRELLNDTSTNYSRTDKTFIISCQMKYYFPLFLIYKENFILENVEINDIILYNVKINYVSLTKDNDTYLILNYEYCYDKNKNISYDEFIKKFPRGTIIDYDDYIKYENEFHYFKTKFKLEDSLIKIV